MTQGSRGRVESLDALRGIAAVSVVLIHCLVIFRYSVPTNGIAAWVSSAVQALANGRNAVVLFFVLSGFVLARSVGETPSQSDIGPFLVKRAFRILPAAYLVLLLMVLLLLVVQVHPENVRDYIQDWAADRLSIPTFRNVLYDVMFQTTYVNTVYWTLIVEVAASIMFIPLSLGNFHGGVTGRWIILASLMILSYHGGDNAVFVFAFCFQLGALAYHYRDVNMPRYMTLLQGTVGIGILCFAHSWLSPFLQPNPKVIGGGSWPWSEIFLEAIGSVFLTHAAFRQGRISSGLAWPPLVALGSVSFSLYLVHMMVLEIYALFGLIFPWFFRSSGYAGILALVVVLPLSIMFSAIIYTFVEKPFVRFGGGLARSINTVNRRGRRDAPRVGESSHGSNSLNAARPSVEPLK